MVLDLETDVASCKLHATPATLSAAGVAEFLEVKSNTIMAVHDLNETTKEVLDATSAEKEPPATFQLKILLPNATHVDLVAQGTDTVLDIRHLLSELPETFQYSAYSLAYGDSPLNDFAELANVPGLCTTGQLQLVEGPYTEREARLHMRRLRDLLAAFAQHPGNTEAIPNCSLSVYHDVLPGEEDRLQYDPNQELSLGDYFPKCKQPEAIVCVRSIEFSGWNPPPGNRRMLGDLLYLELETLEAQRVHVTAHCTGFYINNSTTTHFQPEKSKNPCASTTLLGLLTKLSPGFRRNLEVLKTRSLQDDPYRILPNPYPVHAWLLPDTPHTYSPSRAEDSMGEGAAVDDQIPGLLRDWNEEWQLGKEMPQDTIVQRITRDRNLFRIHCDFLMAATKGAMAVVDGNVPAINANEDPPTHLYIWNNIFISYATDSREYYAHLGGNSAAAHKAAKLDIAGIRHASSVGGLASLLTAAVDYKGHRLLAQAIIPGILRREQDVAVSYGSVDGGKKVAASEVFHDKMCALGRAFGMKDHTVVDKEGAVHRLGASVDSKGITGTDGRHYVLDLFHTTPADTNFCGPEEGFEGGQFKDYSLHGLTLLRSELIDAYRQHRTASRLTVALVGAQPIPYCHGESDVYFNPDVFMPVNLGGNSEELAADRALVQDMGSYLLHTVIPKFIEDASSTDSMWLEGGPLTNQLHARGINMRYLGHLADTFAQRASDMPEDNQNVARVRFAHAQCLMELVVRSIKADFNRLLRHTRQWALAATTAHYLNSLLGCVDNHDALFVSTSASHITPPAVQPAKKGGKKRKGSKGNVTPSTPGSTAGTRSPSPASDATIKVATTEVWERVAAEAKQRFLYNLSVEEARALPRLTILRRVCQMAGIQLLARHYDLSSSRPFIPEDILNLVPRVSHLDPIAHDGIKLMEQGSAAAKNGQGKEAGTLFGEAAQAMTQVYGAMHVHLADCYARHAEALGGGDGALGQTLELLQRAAVMCERLLGVDHHSTVQRYVQLGRQHLSTGHIESGLAYLLHARFYSRLLLGDSHPTLAALDSSIGLLLQADRSYEQAAAFFESALALSSMYPPKDTSDLTFNYKLAAKAHHALGAFDRALHCETEAHRLYLRKFGANDHRTKESTLFIQHLTAKIPALHGLASKDTASAKPADGPEKTAKKVNDIRPTRKPASRPRHNKAKATISRPYRTAEAAAAPDMKAINDLLAYINS